MPLTRKTSELPGELASALVASVNALNAALAAQGALPHHDTTTLVTTADASDLATSVALANALKVRYTAHIADTDAHVAADATNVIAAADASNLATAQTLLNELKADFNLHIARQASHRNYVSGAGGATVAVVSTADAIDQSTANALANALKAAFNRHFAAGAPDIQLVQS